MSIVDHHGEVEYPFSIKTVFKAIIEAAPNIDGLSLDSADEMSGYLTFKAGVSLASWGENIPVQLVKISQTRTKMQILSTPKTGVMFGGAMDFGKNRQNIDKIIKAVSAVLASKPIENDINSTQNISSVADELLKLKKLNDDGILSDNEFEEEKQRILQTRPSVQSQETSKQPENINDSSSAPVHIEGSGTTSSNTLAIVAIIVFVLIFLLALIGL
ncbi:SHOCT domain-containing protein [Bacteroides sp.]|jgi:hypothetical protein|uniref:SHOCT domain-containing protein n=1 Tax=Bacteroides sp. TaxID=29523 RepID=UPI003D10C834